MQFPSDELIKNVLSYSPETGVLTWLRPASNRVKPGAVAGSETSYGYLSVRVNRKAYQAHRVAWYLAHGAWPTGDVDHINGDRKDNRLENLRDVPRAINAQNLRCAKRTSTTGVLGVVCVNERWIARITVGRKEKYLGSFDTSDQASAAYLSAKRSMHEGCTL